VPCSNACKVLTLHRQLQKQPPETPSESNAPSETNTPSEPTEARPDRVKEAEEFMQRQVDPALLTASRSSGPTAHRACPGKQYKAEKVQFLSLIFHARTRHNTCAAVVKSSSSSAAGGRSRACSRRQSSSSTCLQPAGGQERERT
jgi:hypothetical protein